MNQRTAAILAVLASGLMLAGIIILVHTLGPGSLILLFPWLASAIVAVFSVDEYLEDRGAVEWRTVGAVCSLSAFGIAVLTALSRV